MMSVEEAPTACAAHTAPCMGIAEVTAKLSVEIMICDIGIEKKCILPVYK